MIATTTTWFLPALLGAAAADSLNPCAFSILFLSIGFLFSLGHDRSFIIKAGGLYIFGIAFVYTAIGVGILEVLSIFTFPNPLAKIGAVILIIYATISALGEIFPSFPLQLKIPENSKAVIGRTVHKATLPGAFVLGVIVGLFEFPCTGGPYLFALSLIHDKTTFWTGFGYLVLYNTVFVLPLVVILALSSTRKALEQADRLRKLKTKKARLILDFALAAIGLLILMT